MGIDLNKIPKQAKDSSYGLFTMVGGYLSVEGHGNLENKIEN